jgi:prolyl oligopeptidase
LRIARLVPSAALLLFSVLHLQAQGTTVEQPDKYLWLEDVHGARAMAWVKQENAATAKILDVDPHFAPFDAAALQILESPQRLPYPSLQAGEVYNTWRDATHVRGILRRTTLADYADTTPHWQTVLDYDALAKDAHQNWFPKGENCLYPQNTVCMVSLSPSGGDAVTEREFDLRQRLTAQFVPNGFTLPTAKQDVAWLDSNTLLVASDWGPGTLTTSGYPYIVKEWTRGEPLAQARELFRGAAADMAVYPESLHDAQGHHAELILHYRTFFDKDTLLLTANGVRRLALPAKADVSDLLDGQLIVQINQDWTVAGHTYPLGSVLAVDLASALRDPAHLQPSVIFSPTPQEFAQTVSSTRNHLLLTTLEHVQGRAYVYTRSPDGHWTRARLPVPPNQTVGIVTADDTSDRFFLGLTGFLSPSRLLLGDAGTGTLTPSKALPPQFDAAGLTVDQLEATSKDGTRIPYFVVHRKDMPYNGDNPTLMTAYGGFQVSETPYYSAVTGKLWLDRGGVFVLANIRGGGEFGPAWHDAGLTTHRQRIYDDFYAVATDLISRKITSSQKLGIEGGSNGGLLMGVEMTQHPELYKAIVIEVPLLDMLRYEKIAAGASWVGEYGSVSVPAQRAFLASISPYNQLSPRVTYPQPLIFTTTADDRVGPVHARKFAARMQEFGKPFYYYELIEGGHDIGANLKEDARTEALIYTYLTRKLMP